MVEFSVKQVANNIDTSTQYVYQQMPDLIGKGLATRDKNGRPIIYDKGLNFLLEKRKTGLQVANKGLKNKTINNEENTKESTKNEFASNNESAETYKKLYEEFKKLYEEEKQESNRWREMYIEKDTALTQITSSLLLTAGKEAQQQPKRKKWVFWNKK